MKITYANNLGSSPARVNRVTGEIFINAEKWPHIPPGQKKFILAHEMGHYLRQTTDEFAADTFAFNYYAGTEPGSLMSSVSALTDHLGNSHEHRQRSLEIYKKALMVDYRRNLNTAAGDELLDIFKDEYAKQREGNRKPSMEVGVGGFKPTIGRRFHDIRIEDKEPSPFHESVQPPEKESFIHYIYRNLFYPETDKLILDNQKAIGEVMKEVIPDVNTKMIHLESVNKRGKRIPTWLIVAVVAVAILLIYKHK